jgi:hypothetical protein
MSLDSQMVSASMESIQVSNPGIGKNYSFEILIVKPI